MNFVKLLILIISASSLLVAAPLSHARHAALLIDAENGDVLFEMEANQSWYPASLTKLMTLYMTFSALESGRLRLNDELTVSSRAAHQSPSKLGLRTWDSISVEDAILAIITRSANDASVVLAEAIAGSESQFAIKMTSAAHSMGMYGSHFMNATGLPHEWQTTTAHDMAVLARKIILSFPQYYPYFSADSMYFNGRDFNAINKFTANYPGAEGMKTGYTCGSGYNLVGSAYRNGKRLIGVILGGMTSAERYDLMFEMMDEGFDGYFGYAAAHSAHNINSMNVRPVGSAPYQLSCGNHFASRHATRKHYDNVEEDDRSIRYIKKVKPVTHVVHHESRTPTAKPIPKINFAEKAKAKASAKHTAVVAHHAEPVGKKSAKTAKVALVSAKSKVETSSKKSKTEVASAKSKAKATPALAANSHSKGYYSPSAKTNSGTRTADSKKGKGFYNPDKATKSVTKSSAKSTAKDKKSAKK